MLESWVLVVFVFYFAIILPEIETCVVFVRVFWFYWLYMSEYSRKNIMIRIFAYIYMYICIYIYVYSLIAIMSIFFGWEFVLPALFLCCS